MKKALVLSLLLTGCGAPTDNFTYTDLRTRDYTIIDPVFTPFLATFQNYYDVVLKNTHVIFASTNEIIANSSGICSMATNQKSLIMINKDYWDLSNVFGREQLLFHELGHCILNLGHDAGKLDITVDSQTQAIPNSIMYPSSFGNNPYYPYVRQHYLEQLNKMRGMP
jgi:hypothetical protein